MSPNENIKLIVSIRERLFLYSAAKAEVYSDTQGAFEVL
jgi:hypothetical protein